VVGPNIPGVLVRNLMGLSVDFDGEFSQNCRDGYYKKGHISQRNFNYNKFS
jgi:hypothetical protein